MRLTTKNITAAQQTIGLEIDPEAAELAQWIVAYFESEMRAGTRFKDGETVELGWTLLMLRQASYGLEVLEPDFDSMPISWCSGVNNTIRHLHLQRAVCELFGCEPVFPTIVEAGIMSPQFIDNQDYTMCREEPVDSDSGWIFAESGYDGSEGEFCSLYELAVNKMEIVPFLALPASSRVLIKPGVREVTVNSITKSSADTDFLRSLAKM